MHFLSRFCLLFCTFFLNAYAGDLYLRDNLKKAQTGDFIVTAQNKNFTVLHIYDRSASTLTIEEITVPSQKMQGRFTSWKEWIKQNAPGNTSWVMYTIDLNSGQMQEYFSFTKNAWYNMSQADNFLSKLLNLRLEAVPPEDRKKIGLPPLLSKNDKRPLWQPRMVVDGKEIAGVAFDAWRTKWPKDNTDLSGKTIEVYVPQENEKYPSYFPYWLQISGIIGNAKVRIVDSGTKMESPAPPLKKVTKQSNPL